MAQPMGTERRSTILPTKQEGTPAMQQPEYSFADELPFPDQVGVRRGGTLDDVGSAIQGVAFYADQIGFGAPSTKITRDMDLKPFPMGVNYFTKTNTKCSNGADMWVYINGIPEGNIFGNRVKQAMQRLGVPTLRGLAPGIMEDARDALNPLPILNSVFGSGYVQCKEVKLPVGDYFGRLKNGEGKVMITESHRGDIEMINNRPFQKRFVFEKWLSKEEFDKQMENAKYCPDGSLIENHEGENCSMPLLKLEGFKNMDTMEVGLPVAVLLGLAAALWVRYS